METMAVAVMAPQMNCGPSILRPANGRGWEPTTWATVVGLFLCIRIQPVAAHSTGIWECLRQAIFPRLASALQAGPTAAGTSGSLAVTWAHTEIPILLAT